MVNLSKLKDVKLEMSEKTKMEAQMGFTIGIMIGALGAWVFTMFFTQWEWYFKLLTTIGEIGIIGSLSIGFNEIRKARLRYIETIAEMEKINSESLAVIEEKTND